MSLGGDLYHMIFDWDKIENFDENNPDLYHSDNSNIYKVQYRLDENQTIQCALKRVENKFVNMQQILNEIATSVIPHHPCIVPIIGWNYRGDKKTISKKITIHKLMQKN